MPLTVEDGALVANADSYVSLADANAYWAANGAPAAWTSLDDAGKEARLRGAARYLQDQQRLPYTGAIAAWDQALAWPRVGASNYGVAVPASAIPAAIKQAQIWLAVHGYAAGIIGQTGTAATSSNVRSQQIGPLSKSYFSTRELAEGKAVADASAPADLVGMLYGLIDVDDLPTPGVLGQKKVPVIGTSAVLVDSTLPDASFPEWP